MLFTENHSIHREELLVAGTADVLAAKGYSARVGNSNIADAAGFTGVIPPVFHRKLAEIR